MLSQSSSNSFTHGTDAPVLSELPNTTFRTTSYRELAAQAVASDIALFEELFFKRGYQKLPSVRISSGIDPTVRFVGSLTNVFRSTIQESTPLDLGLVLTQPCLKTKNLNLVDASEGIAFGSYFPCCGAIVSYQHRARLLEDTMEYLGIALGLSGDMEIRVSSTHHDLVNDALSDPSGTNVLFDSLAHEKYVHRFGSPDLTGRVMSIALRSSDPLVPVMGVAVLVVIEKNNVPAYVELSISPTLITYQRRKLEHVLDCYPLGRLPVEDARARRKIEDCIITLTVLYRENLRPSNIHNRNRLLKKYLNGIVSLCKREALPSALVTEAVLNFDRQNFKEASTSTQVLVTDICSLMTSSERDVR